MESVVNLMETVLDAAGCRLYARGADLPSGDQSRAVYNFNTTFFNGARREARLKVNIWAKTMLSGLTLERILDEALVRPGERALTDTCVSCVRNGGGWLEDGDWHIRIAYYDLILRAPRGQ